MYVRHKNLEFLEMLSHIIVVEYQIMLQSDLSFHGYNHPPHENSSNSAKLVVDISLFFQIAFYHQNTNFQFFNGDQFLRRVRVFAKSKKRDGLGTLVFQL